MLEYAPSTIIERPLARMFPMETIGDRIKQERLARRWTQKVLGDKVRVSDAAVSRWELGLSDPVGENIYALGVAFGVTTDWLIKGRLPKERGAKKTKTVKASTTPRTKILLEIIEAWSDAEQVAFIRSEKAKRSQVTGTTQRGTSTAQSRR